MLRVRGNYCTKQLATMVALPNIPLKISMFPNIPKWSDYSHSEHSHQSPMETSLDLHFPPTKQPLELTDFIGSLCNSNHLTIFKLTSYFKLNSKNSELENRYCGATFPSRTHQFWKGHSTQDLVFSIHTDE